MMWGYLHNTLYSSPVAAIRCKYGTKPRLQVALTGLSATIRQPVSIFSLIIFFCLLTSGVCAQVKNIGKIISYKKATGGIQGKTATAIFVVCAYSDNIIRVSVSKNSSFNNFSYALADNPMAVFSAGDALIFHSNLLHRSEANTSDRPRWSLIAVYNRSSNVPYNEPSKSSTIPLQAVPDEALLQWQTEGISDGANFLEKEKDEALK